MGKDNILVPLSMPPIRYIGNNIYQIILCDIYHSEPSVRRSQQLPSAHRSRETCRRQSLAWKCRPAIESGVRPKQSRSGCPRGLSLGLAVRFRPSKPSRLPCADYAQDQPEALAQLAGRSAAAETMPTRSHHDHADMVAVCGDAVPWCVGMLSLGV